ncbi:hypothetical protein D3C86_1704320 [compost metagenome]
MSQSLSVEASPSLPSHSCILLAASGWARSATHSRRNDSQRASDSLKKKCVDDLRTGVAPETTEYGFFRSVGT